MCMYNCFCILYQIIKEKSRQKEQNAALLKDKGGEHDALPSADNEGKVLFWKVYRSEIYYF